jgi:glycosyltransferase involved in cell wall biosynthesis
MISLIVATRNRAQSLRTMLKSLDGLAEAPVEHEVVIADNGSTDETSALLAAWRTAGPNRRVLHLPQPGKSRALNAAIRVARGEWLAFLDDDVVVHPNYLVTLHEFLGGHDYLAAQGEIRLPAAAESDPHVMKLVKQYKTIPRTSRPSDGERRALIGANMVIHRAVFEKIGGFNELLGPGASGFGEDRDIAKRMMATGYRIGYMDQVIVTHEVDPQRLTVEAWRRREAMLGKTLYVRFSPSLTTIARKLIQYWFRQYVHLLCGRGGRSHRARGRVILYGAALQMALATKTE